jgi:hypothetical protein
MIGIPTRPSEYITLKSGVSATITNVNCVGLIS